MNKLKQVLQLLFQSRVLFYITVLYAILQAIFINRYADEILLSDPGMYVYYAEECVKHGTMYPDFSNFHDEYIFAPGWINFIILWIRIFGNVTLLPYLNLVFNVGMVYLLFQIGRHILGSRSVGVLASYIYMLMPTFFSLSNHLYTEIPFVFTSTLSFYLVGRYSKKSYVVLIAGCLIAISNWIRPLALAWIIAALFILICRPCRIKAISAYLIGVVASALLIAVFTHRTFPNYLFQASTGGVNLIMTADENNKQGGYNFSTRGPGGIGYSDGTIDSMRHTRVLAYPTDTSYTIRRTDKYSYQQYDSIYKSRAIEWIKAHPSVYTAQFPYKLKNLYKPYTYLYSTKPEYLTQTGRDVFPIVLLAHAQLSNALHYALLLLFILWVVMRSWRKKESLYLLLPVVSATGATILFVTAPRYSVIMLPLIYLGVADEVKHIYQKVLNVSKKST